MEQEPQTPKGKTKIGFMDRVHAVGRTVDGTEFDVTGPLMQVVIGSMSGDIRMPKDADYSVVTIGALPLRCWTGDIKMFLVQRNDSDQPQQEGTS